MLLLKRKFCSFFFFFFKFSFSLSLSHKETVVLAFENLGFTWEELTPSLHVCHLHAFMHLFMCVFFFLLLCCFTLELVFSTCHMHSRFSSSNYSKFFFSFSLSLSHNETAVLAFENFGLTWEEFTPPLHVCHLHSFMHLFLCVFFFLLCYFTVELAFSTCHMHSCFSSSNYSTQWLFCFEPICRTFIIN